MDNSIKKIFSSFKLFQGQDGDSALGVDIGSSAIKIVEIKKKGGKAVLETYGSIALGPFANVDAGRITNLPIEKISEALKEVLKQSGVTTANSGFSIPVQSSLIFTIPLPSQVKESDIPAIVPTEARKYIPLPITEVALDYFMLPEKKPSFEEESDPDFSKESLNKKEVLVVAIQNDAVEKSRSIVSQCSLEAGFFEVEVFSSIRSNFEHELSLVLLVDFGASSTKLSLVEFGMLRAYHMVARGGSDITQSISQSLDISFSKAEEIKREFGLFENPNEPKLAEVIKTHLDYIFSEANNVLLGYEKRYNRTISKIIFTGGGAMMKGLVEVATSNFRVEIEIGHSFSKVAAPEFLDKVLKAIGPEFAVSIGLALRKLE